MKFKIMFFSKWTKSKGKGIPKAMTQSIKYTRVKNDAITGGEYSFIMSFMQIFNYAIISESIHKENFAYCRRCMSSGGVLEV